jgi:hypothetical protein
MRRGYTTPGPSQGVRHPETGHPGIASRTLAVVRNWRIFAWFGAAIVVVFVLGALTVVAFTRTTTTTQTYHGPVRKIVVTSERGAVTIRRGPAGGATVVDHKRYVFAAPHVAAALDAGVLTITATCPMMAFISCSADFTITAPPGVAVNATAQRGLLTVSNITGTVYSNSENGSFIYSGASPSVTGYSLNGNITIRFTAPPRFVHARTETGRVLVALPRAAYAIDANSGIGTHEVVGLTSVAGSSRSIYASSGDGDAKVILTR